MKYIIIALIIAIAFSGCATTTAGSLKYANETYVGKSFDEFVMNLGPPQAKYVLDNGDIIYKWSSNGSLNMPSTTVYNGYGAAYNYGNTATAYGSGTATTFGGGTSHRVCDMTILTTKGNVIKSIKINQDTMGTKPLTASMCAQAMGI